MSLRQSLLAALPGWLRATLPGTAGERTPAAVTRTVLAVAIVALVATSGVLSYGHEPLELGPGAVERPAEGTTVVGVQGFHFEGEGDGKKPARLVTAGPEAELEQVYNGSARGAWWFYDVDPLPNGNVLAVNTFPGRTQVYELDPETGERVWTETFELEDTHDVDLINGDELLIGDKDNDRVLVYNRTREAFVWEWRVADHYPESGGGPDDDWTHLNDVDKVADGQYLVSLRNFDQIVVVNRSTKEIDMRLGADDDHETLYEQHNPTYLTSENGTPTLLVADSENDRVVEYACTDRRVVDGRQRCEWTLVWSVGSDRLNWPRDADRLPNGNTLIVDSMNHRVIEVTPSGRIVWEFVVPWAPYDAERLAHGDEPGGPTMADQGVTGSQDLSGSAGLAPGTAGHESFPQVLQRFHGTPVGGPAVALADAWQGVSQWIKPVWMAPWGFVALVGAVLLALAWALGELLYQRHRIRRELGAAAGRVRERV